MELYGIKTFCAYHFKGQTVALIYFSKYIRDLLYLYLKWTLSTTFLMLTAKISTI